MSQNILQTLNYCKSHNINFLLLFNYTDNQNQTQIDHIECSWNWTIVEFTNYLPSKIEIYDKAWDQTVIFSIKEIQTCIPLKDYPTLDIHNHSEINILIDNMYSNFCERWDNYDYKNAEVIMRYIYQIVKDKSQNNYISPSPFPMSIT